MNNQEENIAEKIESLIQNVVVAKKNNKPATMTIKIKFLYNLALPIDADLALDLKINKIIIITAITINNRIISFCIFR